ncbi:MFS transporter [Ectobacillus sp. sgz5001026]|uniref:MFS transporter n=1 Tax=Ectobacillus sp. sgz5001026 TaxID=3242473 RepID=UPI0036D41195
MWRNKNVWLVLFGEFVAGLGLWLGIIGNLEFMQHYIPSDFLKSLILFSGLFAGVLFGPLAGKMIDEYSKKKILIYSGFGRLISVVFMFLALHFENIWFMVLFMISIQIAAAFYFPALQAIIPLIVSDKQLLQMNGYHMNVSTISRIAGTAVGGALLAVTSLEWIYSLSMSAYAILFLSTFLLHFQDTSTPSKQPSSQQKSGFKEIFHLLKQIPIASHTLLLNVIPLLFIGGFNLVVISISELQHDPTIKGMLYTVEGISFLLGAFLIKYVSTVLSSLKLLYAYSFLIAIAHASLFFSDIKMMAIASFALFGFGVGGFFPVASTIFQTKIDKQYHGRLFSFRNMFERMMFQIVLLATGLFLDTIGLRYMVLIFSGISFFVIVLSSILVKNSTAKVAASSSQTI